MTELDTTTRLDEFINPCLMASKSADRTRDRGGQTRNPTNEPKKPRRQLAKFDERTQEPCVAGPPNPQNEPNRPHNLPDRQILTNRQNQPNRMESDPHSSPQVPFDRENCLDQVLRGRPSCCRRGPDQGRQNFVDQVEVRRMNPRLHGFHLTRPTDGNSSENTGSAETEPASGETIRAPTLIGRPCEHPIATPWAR